MQFTASVTPFSHPHQAVHTERPPKDSLKGRREEQECKITGKMFKSTIKGGKRYYIEQGNFPTRSEKPPQKNNEKEATKKERPIVKYRTFQWRPSPTQIYKSR